jgi:hypothetical protein
MAAPVLWLAHKKQHGRAAIADPMLNSGTTR